ncbi:MAG: HAD-IB family phosphatase [Phycisphaerae bacterium]|nr:HAD-IB family phosphatase [Phycisphaerae bacterium]MDD5380549.1 HAD-IB family phosphatase [Phycisphaerae bacterium]
MNVSVIIPVLNEESTIAAVVKIAKNCSRVDEIIVVDDHSVDSSVAQAKAAGASVITSTKQGKGISMLEGLLISKNPIVVFLDSDIDSYAADVIDKMTRPIIDGRADFVKSTFEREAGRVTELVAKPLLSLLFPEADKFEQPLSGVIAGKREFFEKIKFEERYGADIGILIDMIQIGARATEVNIGFITHKTKQLHQLGKMSNEVTAAILKRAKNLPSYNLDTLETTSFILDQMEFAVRQNLMPLNKMAIFDMDNTLLMGRFIDKVANKFNLNKALSDIITANQESFLIAKLIARLLKGLKISQLIETLDEIYLVPDAVEVIAELKSRGYIVGIVSDSYEFTAQHIRNKVGADFAIANELEFSDGVATGEIKILSYYARTDKSLCNHNFCKSNAMLHLSEKYDIPLSNMIAVGDSDYDACMVKHAGLGVAFCSNSRILNTVADKVIDSRSFESILDFAP